MDNRKKSFDKGICPCFAFVKKVFTQWEKMWKEKRAARVLNFLTVECEDNVENYVEKVENLPDILFSIFLCLKYEC